MASGSDGTRHSDARGHLIGIASCISGAVHATVHPVPGSVDTQVVGVLDAECPARWDVTAPMIYQQLRMGSAGHASTATWQHYLCVC